MVAGSASIFYRVRRWPYLRGRPRPVEGGDGRNKAVSQRAWPMTWKSRCNRGMTRLARMNQESNNTRTGTAADAAAFDQLVVGGPVFSAADSGDRASDPAFRRDEAGTEQLDEGGAGTYGDSGQEQRNPLGEVAAGKQGKWHGHYTVPNRCQAIFEISCPQKSRWLLVRQRGECLKLSYIPRINAIRPADEPNRHDGESRRARSNGYRAGAEQPTARASIPSDSATPNNPASKRALAKAEQR